MKLPAFLRRSLRHRVTAFAIATTLVALLVSGAALVYYDASDYRARRLQDLHSNATIISSASVATLLFNDAKEAQAVLDTLKPVPTIGAAAVYRADGTLFAAYRDPGFDVPARAAPAGHRIERGRIHYFHPIVERGERLGTVFLDAHDGRAERLSDFLGILGAAMVAALAAALLLSAWLQRAVTRPILEVADAARSVLQGGDFTVRARKTSEDEIGALADAFNRMLQEIHQRNTALAESEQRFRTIADSAPVLMWLNDASGAVFVNRAYLEFVGAQRQLDVAGYDWTLHVHPDDRVAYVEAYRHAVTRAEPFAMEFRFRRHDGAYRWMRSVAEPRLAADGECLGYTGCTFDVHDARQAAEALQLADRRKDEFLATLAHELRNPLAPLLSSVALLKKSGISDPQLVWAREVMERQVRHMSRLLDDLLDVGRITSNKFELRRQRVSLASVVEAAVETSRPLLERARHRLQLKLPPDEVFVDADPVRLAQVFSNLLNNAARYTDEGGTIALGADCVDGRVTVSVTDNGIGIAPHDLPHLFELFSQSTPALQRAQGGLGIGLFLVKNLVELHGGTVTADSAGTGHGSVFSVELPVASLPAVAATHARSGALRKPEALRILVADDNADAVDSLAALLLASGYDVRVARDGREAVEVARAFQPAVALLDVGMPRLNGYDVAQHIRAQPWGDGMRLIAITGWGQQDDRRRAMEAGFDGHLTKPAMLEDIERLISGARTTAA
ncbi:MAG: response regulator [Burkholderiaceae bacterium]|nr:response regulator [Burkholderiaceae bacterium]